jgi:prolyl-tRNA synthetase
VVKGLKTGQFYVMMVVLQINRVPENEKFPGAHYTATIETYVSANGRGLQAATSHCLGQSFAKMYDIMVEDPNAKEAVDGSKPQIYVWQNSWGLSTRSLGAMMMTHGDDKGAVIPPRISETQAALIPVGLSVKTPPETKRALLEKLQSIGATLTEANIRVKVDTGEEKSPGWKFNQYEVSIFSELSRKSL